MGRCTNARPTLIKVHQKNPISRFITNARVDRQQVSVARSFYALRHTLRTVGQNRESALAEALIARPLSGDIAIDTTCDLTP